MIAKGTANMDLALSFLHQFPIGTVLTLEDFDNFLVSENVCGPVGLRNMSNPTYAAQSTVRNDYRSRINKGGNCDEMEAGKMFRVVVKRHSKTYEVLSVSKAVQKLAANLPERAGSYIGGACNTLLELTSGHDITQLPAMERLAIEMQAQQIANMDEQVQSIVRIADRNAKKLVIQIKELLSNQITRDT